VDYLRAFVAADYWRAFRSAALKQPWALIFVLVFDLPGMSLVAYLRFVRTLGPTVQACLLAVALVLTALFVYKVGADAWKEVNQQKVRLEDRLRPRLELVLDPTRYDACVQETRERTGKSSGGCTGSRWLIPATVYG
jgi:hypothetical protein